MRTFDYRNIPASLFDGAITSAVMRVYEDKGKLDVLERLHPQAVEAHRAQALFDTIEKCIGFKFLADEHTNKLNPFSLT